MKIAILANNHNSFIRPQTYGLQRLFNRIGIDSNIFFDGHRWLRDNSLYNKSFFDPIKRWLKQFYCKTIFVRRIKDFDVIVIVMNMPVSFSKQIVPNLEKLRNKIDVPIINYDNKYLGTRGPWIDWILNGNPIHLLEPGQGLGLERYDYYLAISVVNEFPMPKTAHPCSVIGIDLNDGTLYSEQNKKFIALIDFERKNFLPERKIQIEALEETDTDYIILNRSYSMEEIRSIYRKSSMYLLAHRESFGLPICELQACGSYILSPYKHWVGSHFIKDVYTAGEGALSSNFIIYNNDKEKLKNEIIKIKRNYNPQNVISNFRQNYPHYWEGDTDVLREFIDNVKNKTIHSQSHKEYKKLNNTIITKL